MPRLVLRRVVLAVAATALLAAVPLVASTATPLASCELRSTDHGVNLLDGCQGQIRPGAPMTSPYGCTYSFVFTDASANLYIGTAGHCTDRVGQRVSTSIVGSFGSVVYRRLAGVNDFSLILVDASKHAFVNPTLCAFGGPVGAADPGSSTPKDVWLEYGWGVATQFVAPTRARAHVETFHYADRVEWTGVGSGGDSGAPIVNQAGYAVGSHTYGQTPLAGVVLEGGPSIANMLAMGRTAVPTLELVLGDPTNFENAMADLTY